MYVLEYYGVTVVSVVLFKQKVVAGLQGTTEAVVLLT